MARKKGKRRTRSPHPGVVLRNRTWDSGATTWFARWTDPDTGKERDTNLTQLQLTTREARRDWAIKKARTVAKRRADLAAGASPRTNTPVEKAVADYLERRAAVLRERTLVAYRKQTSKLTAWAKGIGLRYVEDLTLPLLSDFYANLTKQRRRVPAAGEKRGTKQESTQKRSPFGINSDLSGIRAMLNDWRRFGLIPKLSRDDIHDGLRPVGTCRPRPEFLKTKALRELLEACERHDADTFDLTRDENAGQGTPGTTPKHEPVAPLVVFVLLSGCRIGEAAALPWRLVDLQAQDGVGEVLIAATATKTRQARSVDLTVSPALRRLLTSLKLRTGGQGYVFGNGAPLPRHRFEAARRRLMRDYGAPAFTWQNLRQTCGTFLTNAPGIFGAASAYRSAKQLGHSVQIAERHYTGLVHVPRDAETLEEALGIEALLERVFGPVLTELRTAV